MFTLLFAVIWQFILFVIIVSAVCYIGYWGLVGLALIVYAPSLHSQSPRSWIATHCSHNSNSVGNQGSTTTSKSKLLIGQRRQFWQKCHFSPCPLHRYSIGENAHRSDFSFSFLNCVFETIQSGADRPLGWAASTGGKSASRNPQRTDWTKVQYP